MVKFNRYAMLGIVYYYATALGLFPAQFQANKDKIDAQDEGWPFRVTAHRMVAGFLCWLLTTGGCILCICQEQFNMNKPGINIYNEITVQIMIQIIFYNTFVHGRKRLVKCFNVAYYILQQTNSPKKIPTNVSIIFIVCFLYCINVYYQAEITEDNYLFHGIVCIGILITTVIEVMIATLCSVAQYAFEDINSRLQTLAKVIPQPHQIEELLKFHWKVGHFTDSLSKCFGPILLLQTITAVGWIIFTVVVTVKIIMFGNFDLNTYFLIVELIFIITKILILCISSQILVIQARRPKYILQCICVGKEIPGATMEWIQLFDTQIDLRKIYLNACSSFDINISLLVNICNIVVTYAVCLLQME